MKDVKKIIVLPGDGVGPEIMAQAVHLLKSVEAVTDSRFDIDEHLIGGASLDKHGVPLLPETLERCKAADAVLLGAVGSPQYDLVDPTLRPERALLQLRAELQTFCNLRPAKLYSGIQSASPLKANIVDGTDLLVVRELTGGLYFGEPAGIQRENGERIARNTMVYDENEVSRIAHQAFKMAQQRRGHVTSVDKSDVLEVSMFWRKIVNSVAAVFPDVVCEHVLVDTAAMRLVSNPSEFDVILTSNMFGDILSDIAATLSGSIGLLASASLGNGTPIYEPVHGAAPDIAGENIANPVGMLSSVAMMFRNSLDCPEIALAIDEAISLMLRNGNVTVDLATETQSALGTAEFSALVINAVRQRLIEYQTVRN